MKKIIVFVLLLVGSFLVSSYYFKDIKEEVLVNNETNYYTIYLSGSINYNGYLKVPSTWCIKDIINNFELKEEADISRLDLEENLYDGYNLEIPKKKDDLININYATKEELMSLEGIGESLANKIIEYRNKQLFKSIDELKNISGIKDEKFEKIKDKITV